MIPSGGALVDCRTQITLRRCCRSAPRNLRFIVSRRFYEMRSLNRLLRSVHAIPITADDREDFAAALEHARRELLTGHVVCNFPEGVLSRTGAPSAFMDLPPGRGPIANIA